MLVGLLTVAACSRKYQVKVSHGTPPPEVKNSASSRHTLFYHGSLLKCFVSPNPESIENISFDDTVAILQERLRKKCGEFPVTPLGSFRFCHFDHLAYREDSATEEQPFIPIAFHSRDSGIRAGNGTVVGKWVHNQTGKIGLHTVEFVYACNPLAGDGYIASVRRLHATEYAVTYHCVDVCPFDPNRQVIYPIRCYPKKKDPNGGRE
jgi:hypothetical protein